MKKRIAIIDPFFSGGNFRNIAESIGYEVICIQSSPNLKLPPIQPFNHYFFYDRNLDELIKKCAEFDVKAVFAGCENGVLLADRLSEKLNLVTNGTRLSLSRRDKGEMKKIFKMASVTCAEFKEFYAPSLSDILNWMQLAKLRFPVVLKPAMAFGSINVFFCSNSDDIKDALNVLLTQDLSEYGIENKKILAEEYIDGEEYIVNILGNGEELFITDVWKYEKKKIRGRKIVYSVDTLDPKSDHEILSLLIESSRRATKALGIQYGCAHVELKIDSSGVVKIIEVGARISGAHLGEIASEITGQPLELAVIQAFLNQRPVLKNIYSLKKHASVVLLFSKQSGKVRSISGFEAIKNLPSFNNLYLHVREGDSIKITEDVVSSPGLVILAHENKAQLERDKILCRQFFDLEVFA